MRRFFPALAVLALVPVLAVAPAQATNQVGHPWSLDTLYHTAAAETITVKPDWSLGAYNTGSFSIQLVDSAGTDTTSCTCVYDAPNAVTGTARRSFTLKSRQPPRSMPARVDSLQLQFPNGHEAFRLIVDMFNGVTDVPTVGGVWPGVDKGDTIYASISADIDSLVGIGNVENLANVQSVDAVDEVTRVDSLTGVGNIENVGNVQSVDAVDAVTLIDSLAGVGNLENVGNVQSVDAVDAVTLVDSLTGVGNVENVGNVQVVAEVTSIPDTVYIRDKSSIGPHGVHSFLRHGITEVDSIPGTTAKYHEPITSFKIMTADTLYLNWRDADGDSSDNPVPIWPGVLWEFDNVNLYQIHTWVHTDSLFRFHLVMISGSEGERAAP